MEGHPPTRRRPDAVLGDVVTGPSPSETGTSAAALSVVPTMAIGGQDVGAGRQAPGRGRSPLSVADPVPGSNEQIARRWFTEGWAGEVDLAEVIFDSAFTSNGIIVGPAGPRRNVLNRIAGFPDLQTDIEDLVAVGDQVVIRLQWSGTHSGPYGGVRGDRPAGRGARHRHLAVPRGQGRRGLDGARPVRLSRAGRSDPSSTYSSTDPGSTPEQRTSWWPWITTMAGRSRARPSAASGR